MRFAIEATAQMTERKEESQDAGKTRPVRNVISYLRSLDGNAHPALDSINSGVVFDAANSVYIVEPPIESLNDEVEREAKLFADALKAYEEDPQVPKKYKTGIDIDHPHSIGDVIEQIDVSLKEYKNESEKTVWQFVRKGWWKLGESQDGIKNWMALLPSESEYGSLICGGLNLIIKAAGRIGDVRNEAFRALAEIPFHLESTRESVGIFSKSDNLRKCGVKLYTVTLDALRHILKWFKKRAIGKGISAFLKQGLYQKELLEKIAEIERVSVRFKDISMSCLQQEVVHTSKTVTSVAVATGNNHVIIKNTIDQTNIRLERLRISDVTQHEATKEILDTEFKTLKQQYEDQKELNQRNADALNDCKTLLESIYVALPLCFQPADLPKYEASEAPPTNLVTSSRVLTALNHEKDTFQNDLASNLRGLNSLSRNEQDRAIWTMKNHLLRGWLLGSASSALFVNGSAPSTRAKSPITFVCARLIDSLQSNKDFLVLHFFCGQHLSAATDPNADAFGMMNSLLAQLLILYSHFEILHRDLLDVQSGTLDSVLTLFEKLVAQLPATLFLFVIIDGVSFYEDAVRLAETRTVIERLMRLVRDEGLGAVFKLIATSPTRIRNLLEEVEDDEILSVPREVPHQSGLSVLRNGKVRREEAN